MYFILIHLQRKYDMGQDVQQTLFQNFCIEIHIQKLLDTVAANATEIRKAAKDMMKKPFDIDLPDDEWLLVGLVNYVRYHKSKQTIEFEISSQIQPYLFDLAKGYTAYNVAMAISLKSVYSQRFYEFCNQWKDTGKWNISVQKLKEILSVDKDYELYANFKQRVLEPARKELLENAKAKKSDVWFDYKEKKVGRKVQELLFTIYWPEKKLKKAKKEESGEDLQYVNNILSSVYHDKKLLNKALDELIKRKLLVLFAKRLDKLEEKALQEKKPLSEYGGYVRHILKEDFKITL